MEKCAICNKKISKMKIKKHLSYDCLYNYKYLFEINAINKFIIGTDVITLRHLEKFINKNIIKQNTYGYFYFKNYHANYKFANYYDDMFYNYEKENVFEMLTWETNKYIGEGDHEYYSPDTERYNSNVKISELYLINNNKFEYILETNEYLDIKILQINNYNIDGYNTNEPIKIIWHNNIE